MRPLDWIAGTLAWAGLVSAFATIAVVVTVAGWRLSVDAYLSGVFAAVNAGCGVWATWKFVRIVKGYR